MRSYNAYIADRGTVTAPGYSFGNQTNTGIYGRSDGGVGIGVKGVPEIEITGDGKYQYSSTSVRGDHNFAAAASLTYTYQITGAGTNNKNWDLLINTTSYSLLVFSDDYSAGNVALRFTRNGAIITLTEMSGNFVNMYDSLYNIGEPTRRFKDTYAFNNESIQSDTQVLTNSRVLTAAELAAWAAISPKLFNVPNLSALKCAYIGQEIVAAFNAQSLNALNYNLVVQLGTNPALYFIKLAECLAFEAAYQRSMLLRRGEWSTFASQTLSSSATAASVTLTGLADYNELNFTLDSIGHNYTTASQAINIAFSLNGTAFGTAQTITPAFPSTSLMFGQVSMADPKGAVSSIDSNCATITVANAVTLSTQTPRIIKPGGQIVAVRFSVANGVMNGGIFTARGRR